MGNKYRKRRNIEDINGVKLFVPTWLKSNSAVELTSPLFPSQIPKAPKVLYTDRAWAKIWRLVNTTVNEVGWWQNLLERTLCQQRRRSLVCINAYLELSTY